MSDYASDAGGRTYKAPKKKPPRKRIVSPDDRALVRSPEPTPKKRIVGPDDRSLPRSPPVHDHHGIEPLDKPVPVLQSFGFHGSIHDFAARLGEVTRAHEQHFGYKPSPGLAFDLARFNQPVDFGELFRFPRSQRAAEAWQGLTARPQKVQDKETAQELLDAAQDGSYNDYIAKNPEVVHDLLRRKPGLAAKAAGYAIAREIEEFKLPAFRQQRSIMGIPVQIHNPMGEVVWRGGTQIADSLIHSPGGLYSTVKASAQDLEDAQHGHPQFKRSRKIAQGTVEQTKEDVEHPLRNPGYLFLDIMGFASAGAGGVARVGAAGRALRAGEGAGTVGRALVRRPEGGRFTMTKGGASEEVILSENASVRAVQRLNLQRRQKGMTARHEAEFNPTYARAWLQENFSFETKMGREARARMRYEHTLAMNQKRNLEAVAGSSINQARVFSRIPKRLRKGLTRGEQKAIQVLSWDDPNPLAAERKLHQDAIDADIGDPKAHRRQLADLKLAEQVLNDPKPRPRFQEALALTRQVIADQERIKIEQLGLDPVTAEKRVIASGEALRGEPLREGTRQNPESFYLPQIPKGKSKRAPYERVAAPRIGVGGIPPPRNLPELHHIFEGKAIQAGNIRIDATALAGESYAKTVRAASIKNDYDRLWAAAADTKKSKFHQPIRNVKDIPDKLREVLLRLDEGSLSAKDLENLHEEDIKALHEALFPDEHTLPTIQGVKWVDTRIMGTDDRIPQVPGRVMKGVGLANEIPRALTLYRPAYILNLLGSTGMGLLHQGPFLVPNVSKAIFSKRIYGEEASGTIEALMDEGRAKSYVAEGTTARVSQKIASFWGRVTDRDLRVSALLHELGRKGFSVSIKDGKKLNAELKDPARQADVIEAARRANKGMVEFNNQTWYEKNYFRHVIFVYPWVSRSAVWSLRTIMEHPIKTDVLSHLGRMEEEDMDSYFKHSPEWFKKTGYFPVGWQGDKPKIVNPTSVNSFSTLGELLNTADAGVNGNVPYTATSDMFGPLASYALHASTGRDEFGNEYPNGQWIGAAQEVLGNLPEIQARKRAQKENAKAPPFDITDRGSLSKRQKAALKNTVFSPGWLDGYGTLFAGGFTPRLYDPDAAAARYWATQPWKERHQHEQALIQQALELQGELLGQKVPKQVKQAVAFAGKRETVYKEWQEENGRDPTTLERTKLDLQLLEKEHRISEGEADKLRSRMKELELPAEVQTFRARMLEKFGGANDMHQWDEDVRWVASFKPEVVGRDMEVLRKAGLGSAPLPKNPKALTELGRVTLDYRHELKRREKEIREADGLDESEKRQLRLELEVWRAGQDKPVTAGGHKFPSAVRMVWARQTDKQRQDAIDATVTKPWANLSPLEKELVGKKVDPKTAKGWQQYDEFLTTGKEGLQGQQMEKGYPAALAKWIEAYGDDGKPVPGFYKDFLFSKQPLYQRLQAMKPIQKSKHSDLWRTIFVYANAENQYLKDPEYSGSEVRRTWKAYVKESLYPWLQEEPGFRDELERYGGMRVLSNLLNG